jgi:Fe-S cluster assembly scaffold protein SufB
MDLRNINHHNTASGKEDIRLDNDRFSIDTHQSPIIPQTEHTSVIETDIQYPYDSIRHNLREYLRKKGVIVVDMDTAVKRTY